MIAFDFYRFAPPGVGLVGVTDQTNFWSAEDMETALSGALDSAGYLGDRGCDYMVHTGAAHVASRSPGYDTGLLAEMERRARVGCTSSIRSALQAFARLGLRRVAVASPRPERITTWVVDYIRVEGIWVPHVAFLGTDFTLLHTVEPSAIYRFARQVAAAAPNADGLYMPGPQAPVAMTVAAIEQDIGKPVIASTPADFWAAFHRLGIRDRIEGHGALLASLARD